MIRDHFPHCDDMPGEVRELYGTLRRGPKNPGLGNAARMTKEHWAESAGRCGLYDVPDGNGIRYKRPADGQGVQLPTGGAAGAAGVADGVATVGAATAPAEQGAVAKAASSRKASRKKRKYKKRKPVEAETSVETVAV